MAQFPVPYTGSFALGSATAAGGTAFIAGIPPYQSDRPNMASGVMVPNIIHVTKVCYTTGVTAHAIGILRPLNKTTIASNAAAAQAVVNITADPGLYATNWAYQSIGTPRVADNAIAANDYVAYQCANGSFMFDKVASVSTLAITMTANVPTGGALAGGFFYFFGVIGDTQPITNGVHVGRTIGASLTADQTWTDPTLGICQSLCIGDPLMFYSPNTTNAGTLEYIVGFFSKY